MITTPRIAVLAVSLSLAACASVPSGPNVMVMPGSGKNFDQFRIDDADCRQHSNAALNGATPAGASVDSGVKSAAIGAGVGALAGAAIGGSGRGAGTGAGLGLIVGALAGSGAANASGSGAQQRYDNSYVQCMYAKGNQVPVSAGMAPPRYRAPGYAYPAPLPPGYYPAPPPPGYYPPPGYSAPAPGGSYPPPPPGYTVPLPPAQAR